MRVRIDDGPAVRPRKAKTANFAVYLWIGLLLLSSVQVRAEKAHLLYTLGYPESDGQWLDPGSITVDSHTGEVFITDTHGQRVVIFDQAGRYAFDFADPEHLPGLRQTAVDSLGRIYVLRDRNVSISVFDYNGDYLRDMNLARPGSDQLLEISSFLFDRNDQMYVLTVLPAHLYIYTSDGQLQNDYPLFNTVDSVSMYQQSYGTMALVGDKLAIPFLEFGSIGRCTIDGKFVDFVGVSGGGPRTLSLPVAAAADANGNLIVLDKHRGVVQMYDDKGQFVKEFGGQGESPGWFYQPTTLAIGSQNEAIVGETFKGMIQAIALTSPAADSTRLGSVQVAEKSK